MKIRNELGIVDGSTIAVEKVKNVVVLKKVDDDLLSQFKEGLEDLKARRIRRVA